MGRSRIENETVCAEGCPWAQLSSALPKDVQNLLPACRLCQAGHAFASCPCYSTLSLCLWSAVNLCLPSRLALGEAGTFFFFFFHLTAMWFVQLEPSSVSYRFFLPPYIYTLTYIYIIIHIYVHMHVFVYIVT